MSPAVWRQLSAAAACVIDHSSSPRVVCPCVVFKSHRAYSCRCWRGAALSAAAADGTASGASKLTDPRSASTAVQSDTRRRIVVAPDRNSQDCSAHYLFDSRRWRIHRVKTLHWALSTSGPDHWRYSTIAISSLLTVDYTPLLQQLRRASQSVSSISSSIRCQISSDKNYTLPYALYSCVIPSFFGSRHCYWPALLASIVLLAVVCRRLSPVVIVCRMSSSVTLPAGKPAGPRERWNAAWEHCRRSGQPATGRVDGRVGGREADTARRASRVTSR